MKIKTTINTTCSYKGTCEYEEVTKSDKMIALKCEKCGGTCVVVVEKEQG
jgi:ssDNA-binding Zn-finger/Zn-ribbon topoisomerase 1